MSKRVFLFFIILVAQAPTLLAQPGGAFIENIGQYPPEVKFYTHFNGGKVFIEATGMTYVFQDPASFKPIHDHHQGRTINETEENYAVKLKFLDTGQGQAVAYGNVLPTRYNYFYDQNPEHWVSGARSFSEVAINNLYPGVDFKLSYETGQLKYDLVLAPGIDPAAIRLEYAGVNELMVDDEGDLNYVIPYQQLEEQIPASYAICDQDKRRVKSSYIIEDNVVSFAVEDIDPAERLVIDPLLVFSTYSGSPSDNWGNTATFDNDGNAYAGGITTTVRGDATLGDFPTTAGAFQTQSAGGWDVALMKYDSTGSNLLYATYLGGRGSDVPQSLIVDENGDLLILGVTSSDNFPVSAEAYDQTFNGGTATNLLSGIPMNEGIDLFVTKLSADGSQLLGSTYLGGTSNDGFLADLDDLARNYGDESRGDINFDTAGNIIVASRTQSDDFPTVMAYDSTFNGNTDAVLLKLTPQLDALQWSTFLGGGETDIALSIKLDQLDNIYVAGGTSSDNFPTTDSVYLETYGGNVDGWVARLPSTGDSLVASSFIGTMAYDQTFFMDLDAAGNVYLAGQTMADYPVSPGKYSSGTKGQFIHKLSSDLRQSLFSTVIGSNGTLLPNISLTAFLVNDCDNIYLSGWGSNLSNFNFGNNFTTNTIGLPVTFDAYDIDSDGSSFYLAVLSGDASQLLYATHLGDSRSYVHVDGGTSRFDKNGIVYHSVCASCANDDSSFPTTEGAYAESNASVGCSNAIFKFDLASLRARIQTNNIELTEPGYDRGCLPLTVTFENLTTGGQVYEWDFGDGKSRTVYSKDTIRHVYEQSGSFRVQLRAYDPNTCIAEDWAYTTIIVAEPIFSIPEDQEICYGSSVRLIATGGTSYEWFPKEGLDNPFSGSPIAAPSDTTLYSVQITNTNGCNFQGSVMVNVIPEIIPRLNLEQSKLCEGSREIRLTNDSENAESITWSFGDGNVDDSWETNHEFTEDGQYLVTGTLRRDKCVEQISYDLNILELNIPNVLTRNNDGFNDVLKITSATPVQLTIYTRWGTKVFEAAEYNNDWAGDGLRSGIYFYEALLVNGEVCSGWIQLLNDSE